MDRLSTEELDALEKRYTAEPVPPCRVCNGPLTIQRQGGGEPTVWACTGQVRDDLNPSGPMLREPGRKPADKHYSDSRFIQYQSGDSAVLAVIAEVREYRARLDDADQKKHLISLTRTGWTIQHSLECRLKGELLDCDYTCAAEQEVARGGERFGYHYRLGQQERPEQGTFVFWMHLDHDSMEWYLTNEVGG